MRRHPGERRGLLAREEGLTGERPGEEPGGEARPARRVEHGKEASSLAKEGTEGRVAFFGAQGVNPEMNPAPVSAASNMH